MSSNSPTKGTNEIVVVVKMNSFVRFLGEFEDTKSLFEIIGPLVRLKICQIPQSLLGRSALLAQMGNL